MKNFGETLKKIRRQKDMTQEQLAEYLNISPQSVSKWETNLTLPDITLIPMLANIFDVTTDTLLGVDIDAKEECIKKIQKETFDCLITSRFDEAEKILRAGLKEYPNSYGLMVSLMSTLNNVARLPRSKTERKAFNEEIIALGEKILAECTNDDTRHWAIQQLCYAYCDIDEHEKARSLVNKLAGRGATREYLLGHILKGTEKFRHIQIGIARDVSSICTEILQLNNNLLDGEIAEYNSDEVAALNHKVIDIINILCEDGKFGYFSHTLNNAHLHLCEFNMYQKRDNDAALKHFKLAAKHAILFDVINRTEYGAAEEFTCLLFRGLKSGFSKNIAPFSCSQYLLERIVSGNYYLYFPAAEVNAVKEELLKYANPAV